MAKFGEGDPRWLVEKREDGRNVNQWHWTEKDCLAWSKARLQELFSNLTLVAGSVNAHTTGLESVTGDAILNVRKAKLIPSYELAIKIKWQGTSADGQPGSGIIELPYVADENHDEDPEIKVVLPVEDAPSRALKEAVLAGGKQDVLKAIHTFTAELRAGVPAQHSSSGSCALPAAQQASTAAAAAGAAPAAAADVSSNGVKAAGVAAAQPAAPSKAKSRCTVQLSERFYAKAQDIYECFVVQGRVQAFTRSPAVVEPQPGGSFSWFNSHVQGKFEELQPGKLLVFTWRFNNWEDSCYSKVVIELSEPEPGNTILSLTQTGLPDEDKFGHAVQEQVEEGWKRQVFSSIKAVFGYGV